MSFFSPALVGELFFGRSMDGDRGWIAAVLPEPIPGERGFDLSEAWSSETLGASFVFSTADPGIAEDRGRQQTLVDVVGRALAQRGVRRGVFWLPHGLGVEVLTPDRLYGFGFDLATGQINVALSVVVDAGISFLIDNGMPLAFDAGSSSLQFRGGEGNGRGIHFSGFASPEGGANSGTLPFAGARRGCLVFDMGFDPDFLRTTWFWGFQFQAADPAESEGPLSVEWLPFTAAAAAGSDMIPCTCALDPGDLFNRVYLRRTFFGFASGAALGFESCYRTSFGYPLRLFPLTRDHAGPSELVGGFAFAAGESLGEKRGGVYVTPSGDYALGLSGERQASSVRILCGLEGTESIGLRLKTADCSGDRLRFVESQPSRAPAFPLPVVSPLGSPVDLSRSLLDSEYTTSWVELVPAPEEGPAPSYAARPSNSPLYGRGGATGDGDGRFLDPIEIETTFDRTEPPRFPLPPYSGFAPGKVGNLFAPEEADLFEKQILSPTRRIAIGAGKPVGVRGRADGGDVSATTASGQIVNLDPGTGDWKSVLVAQVSGPTESRMLFQKPQAALRQAFQTSDLMLVVANPTPLAGSGGSSFDSRLSIEDWTLQAAVGSGCEYGSYANVMIFKGVKGKLYDPKAPETGSLVANPGKWTQKFEFAAPNGKKEELTPLAQWLLEYFADAAATAASASPEAAYFEKFNALAQDENWTGILVLRARIAGIPESIEGLLAGVDDPSAFYAHHFAIESGQITQDESGIRLKDSSSVYGLIYYADPAYDPSVPDEPVPPVAGRSFDFRLLSLKVLFENSAVKCFQSTAQLAVNELFGSAVRGMGEGGNLYNCIMLQGSLQTNGGSAVYAMSSAKDYAFFPASSIFNKIEITAAEMSTLAPSGGGDATGEGETEVWFGLSGFLDFVILKDGSGPQSLAIDLLSFGSPDGAAPRAGLAFSDLGLLMCYPPSDPAAREFSFSTARMRFDPATSTARGEGLYSSFALEVAGIVSGKGGDETPAGMGYLPVISDLRLSGVGSGAWTGLKYRLNLGSPGELAGKIGLEAELLLAWPAVEGEGDSGYALELGLLPPGGSGASTISLQNVLSLSFGQIRLLYAERSGGGRSFLLLLTEIALKFLGLLKLPPNGSTLFYLFGNPDSGGKASGLGWYAMYKKGE